MKTTTFGLFVFMLCTILGAFSPQTISAVAYVPHSATEAPKIDSTLYKRVGSTVYLFHGVEAELVQPLMGQEFAVYRESAPGCPSDKLKVGQIRLTKSTGNHHVEAVVIEGELKGGDIAHLGAFYGLVILTKERCETLKPPLQEPIK